MTDDGCLAQGNLACADGSRVRLQAASLPGTLWQISAWQPDPVLAWFAEAGLPGGGEANRHALARGVRVLALARDTWLVMLDSALLDGASGGAVPDCMASSLSTAWRDGWRQLGEHAAVWEVTGAYAAIRLSGTVQAIDSVLSAGASVDLRLLHQPASCLACGLFGMPVLLCRLADGVEVIVAASLAADLTDRLRDALAP